MSEILKKYEESTSPTIENARKQSEGDQSIAVNFFDIESTYQNNFTTRKKGNTMVSLSNDGNHTEGNFKDGALKHYNKEIEDLPNLDHHRYNRSDVNQHYVTMNDQAFGVRYQPTYSTNGSSTSTNSSTTKNSSITNKNKDV